MTNKHESRERKNESKKPRSEDIYKGLPTCQDAIIYVETESTELEVRHELHREQKTDIATSLKDSKHYNATVAQLRRCLLSATVYLASQLRSQISPSVDLFVRYGNLSGYCFQQKGIAV